MWQWWRKDPVPISGLASYAEDPVRYVETKGGAWNAKAAAKGLRRHWSAGRTRTSLVWLVVAVAAALGAILLWGGLL